MACLLVAGLVAVLFGGVYMLFRNEWVFEQRGKLIYYNIDGHLIILEYEDYDTMMRKFWVWDIEKFKKKA